jgi:glycosyltransferase involved in cell wall biosynthesis
MWARQISKALQPLLAGKPLCLWMNSAGKLQHGIAMRLMDHAATRVFDSSDDFTAWEPPDYRRRLQEMVSRCDKLLCVNDHVAETFTHPEKRVFRNCTDFDNFQHRDPSFRLDPWFPKPSGSVYVGFTGGINSTRADIELLTTVFRRFPHGRFLFVGYSDDPGFLDRLTALPNVSFVPERPYKELPEIIRSFDVAIIPHADNPTTRGNDLLKVLDYMACGVPVVSTRCSNIERYRGAIHIADTVQEFGDLLQALVSGTIRHDPGPGLRAAAARSWKEQVPELLPWLVDVPVMVQAR